VHNDPQTGALRRTLTDPKSQLESLAFSPDGKTLASGQRRTGVADLALADRQLAEIKGRYFAALFPAVAASITFMPKVMTIWFAIALPIQRYA